MPFFQSLVSVVSAAPPVVYSESRYERVPPGDRRELTLMPRELVHVHPDYGQSSVRYIGSSLEKTSVQ
jgi:hypothetical protein